MLFPTLSLSMITNLLLLAICYPILRLLYNISPLHPLSQYPGPLLWRASRLPWILALHSGYLHQCMKDFHDHYGTIVRLAPDELSYIDPQAQKDIYVSAGRNADGESTGQLERNHVWFRQASKDDPFSIMGYNEAAHARFRRAFMSAFSDKALRDQMPLVKEHVDGFITKLKEVAKQGRPVDLVSWFNFLMFDISGHLSFGESFGSVDKGEAHPWVAISCKFGKGVAMMASLNFLGLTGVLGGLLKFIMPKAVRDRMIYHRELTKEKVQEKVQEKVSAGNDGKRADFMDALLRFNEGVEGSEKSQQTVTTQELEINMSILIFAGSETVSSALASIITCLIQNRRWLSQTTAEIRAAFTSEEDIGTINVGALPILEAVIKESIRLGPPTTIGVPRVVPKGGAIICNALVPEGTLVAVNQFPAFRSESNFEHGKLFMPGRWLDLVEDPKDETSIFQPFGLGRHQCIGQRLALAELRMILARMLYVFDFEGDVRQGIADFGSQKTFIFWEKEPLMVKLKPRLDT